MSSSDTFDTKERVRQAVDIVDLVGEQIALRRQGRGFVGLCPWHSDSRPSLQVNPERQSWKCWVCDIGGDVFSFVMKREGVDFREAMQMLADRAGIELSRSNKPRAAEGSPEDKHTLYRAMAWAVKQFHHFLREAQEADEARVYLEDRGINRQSIEDFQIGFAPSDWRWLLRRAESTPFSREVLAANGLVLRSERTSDWYDRFRGRVLFPICDTQRRPIALGGRILPQYADEKSAKYINSPETRLFSKSDQLYGLDLARDEIARQREAVVMEGYTDVVIARQHGLQNVVAVLGTALGTSHIQLLKRYADRVVLVLDGDEAGQRRTNEVLELFISNQVDVRIVTLPAGLDPCDYLLEHGSDAMRQVLSEAVDVWDHKIAVVTRGVDLIQDTHRSNQALEDLLSTLAKAPRPQQSTAVSQQIRQHQVLNRLARAFRVDEADLRRRLDEARQRTSGFASVQVPIESAPPKPERLSALERDLLEFLTQYPAKLSDLLEAIDPQQLPCREARQVLQRCIEIAETSPPLTFDKLLLSFDDPGFKNLLVELDEIAGQKRQLNADADELLCDIVKAFHRQQLQIDLQRDQAALNASQLSEQEQLQLLTSFLQKRREITDE